MLKVGLTGGIAAGKSVVGKMFLALGAYLVEADHIAHSLRFSIPTARSTGPSWPRLPSARLLTPPASAPRASKN
jgi:hypothetical protein